MELRNGIPVILITIVLITSGTHGQECENKELTITHITERTATLAWPDTGGEPYTVIIIPHPCAERQPDNYYGCSCEEDIGLSNETIDGTEHTIDRLFPGRLYEFIIEDDSTSDVAHGCTYTVPREPTVFQFDAQASPNPLVDAIGVEVHIPSADGPQCDPETYSEITNRFEWFASNGTWNVQDNIIRDPDPDGHFRFYIRGFEPGREYGLSIRTTSGDKFSRTVDYESGDGTFKTAIPNVENVDLRFSPNKGFLVLHWDRIEDAPFGSYIITANTTTLSDFNYSYNESRRAYNDHDLDALVPGYEYAIYVENVIAGYKQQDPPKRATGDSKIKPMAPSDVTLIEQSVDSVTITWEAPTYTAISTEIISYNVSVTGTPCDPLSHCFCTICNTYGDATHTHNSNQFEILSLFSGREYNIEVRTVTAGPIPSDPADGTDTITTLPRAPLEVNISSTGTTNTSIPLVIVRSEQCDEATEVERYDWYAQNEDGSTLINGSLSCDETRSTIAVDVDNLQPGEEYETCIETVSGELKSNKTCSGYTKTKINAPVITTTLDDDNTTISVSWDTVSGEIYGYELLCETTQGDNRTDDTLDQAATSGKCEDVTPGALYIVTVNSVKDGYEQYAVNLQNKEVMRPYPVKPTFIEEVIDTSTIKITWKLRGHLDLIKYQIHGGPEEAVPASQDHIAIGTNLEPNGQYDIDLWGVAGDGEDDFETATRKDFKHFQMYSAEVGDLKIDNKNANTIEITWSSPPDNAMDTDLNHYTCQLWYLGECARTIIMNNTDLPQIAEIEGWCGSLDYENFTGSSVILTLEVEPCTNYTIIVIPVNTAGNGMNSTNTTETELMGPSEPVVLSVSSPSATEIKVLWDEPEPRNCPMSTLITLSYFDCDDEEPKSFDIEVADGVYGHNFTELQPFTEYNITIKVFNNAGSTNSTDMEQTLSSEPGPPQNLSIENIGPNNSTINWDPVAKCDENGNIMGYVLQVCSRDKLDEDADESCTDEIQIPDSTSYALTGLQPYYSHKCILKTRNENFESLPIDEKFETKMYNPDEPSISASATCLEDQFEITITPPNKLNGIFEGYEMNIFKEGSEDKWPWSCTYDTCDKYRQSTDDELKVNQDHFDEPIDLYHTEAYNLIIECIIKNTEFSSEPGIQSIQVDDCQGSGTDVGLIVGLTFMSIAIIIIILGLIYAKMKRIGPFNDSDTGFNYLDGQSMEAVPVGGGDTPNNHTAAGTANAAFIKEDDIEVVESSSPIQIDQFEAYCNDAYGDSQYKMAEQFGVIKKQSPVHEGIECRRPENKPKNRYTNILPFDWSLVKLKTRIGVPFSEYINATYIPGEWGKDEYIATQGPVTETIDDFWRMVWEQDTPIVIMLTVFVQNNKAKCVMYWPEAGSTMVCGDILVTTKSSDSWGFDDQYRTREIHLKRNDQVRVITQYQMVEWPDYGCPDSPDELLDLVETVRLQCPDDRMTRLVVHCSAGVGRTGTYIAVDRLRQQLDKKEPTDTIDIQAMISEMREYRPHMVQTEAQYTYIHDCVNAMLLRKHGQNVDNGEVDIYENTDYPRKVSAESADSDNPTMSGAMPYPIKVSADSTDSDKPTMSGTMSMSVIV